MTKEYQFHAVLEKHPSQNATFVSFPYNVKEEFDRKRIKIRAWIDGQEYRGVLANMGRGPMIGVSKAIRERIGKGTGDSVHVRLIRDNEHRVVEMPTELVKLLNRNPEEKKFYENLSFTNRKEFAVWITNAKKEQTRQKRLLQILEKLREKKKNPYEK